MKTFVFTDTIWGTELRIKHVDEDGARTRLTHLVKHFSEWKLKEVVT